MKVLVVNVGSSSVKLRLLGEGPSALAAADLRDTSELVPAVDRIVREHGLPDAVGHRIVHGGPNLKAPAVLDRAVLAELEALRELAPLHQSRCLEGVARVGELLPRVPAVGCFDTAFFSELSFAASTYPVPKEWRERFGIKRFGFHGLSHSYVARRVSEMSDGSVHRIVSCHLGSGASLAAIHDGRAVDTTMGFTPLEGVVMATRSGTVDPGLILWLLTHGGLDASEVAEGLEARSGLVGLAGTGDMQQVLVAAAAGDERAGSALDVYVHRLRGAIGSMVASMDGIDALVFTGGIGEGAAEVREACCAGLTHLDVRIDPTANAAARPDSRLDGRGRVAVFVIGSREDLEISAQTRGVLAQS